MSKRGRPSDAQLAYLDDLGYTGAPPQTMREASVAIDAIKETGRSDLAEAELLRERAYAPTRDHAWGNRRVQSPRHVRKPRKMGCVGRVLLLSLFVVVAFFALGLAAIVYELL